jgi:hypothetical protein
MTRLQMVPLVSAGSAFEARVLIARLGAAGILAQSGGPLDGPYAALNWPVEVLVAADQEAEARELLLADAVEHVLAQAQPSIEDESLPF